MANPFIVDAIGGNNSSVGRATQGAPPSATAIGVIDSSGNIQQVSATNPVPTTVSGTAPLPTGAATAANQTAVIGTLAPGTSATNSLLAGGVYSTPAPTLTNGEQVALQVNASGGLVVDGSAVTQPISGNITIGSTASDGSTTITTGGTAQNLFSGATPSHGFAVYNPDPSNDLWVSDSTTAAANGTGSIRVPANGGGYETPPGYKPFGAVSIVGAVTGQKITARKW